MGSNFPKATGISYRMNEFSYRNINSDMIKNPLRIYNPIGRNFYEKLSVRNQFKIILLNKIYEIHSLKG